MLGSVPERVGGPGDARPVALTRLWPLAWDGGRGDDRALKTFRERSAALLEREDLWAEDFAACSHWMPQYLWLGSWFGAGCP